MSTSSAAISRFRGDCFKDCLFLVSIVTISFLCYIGNLGFYSDDWDIIKTFSVCGDQSVTGLSACMNESYRPLQFLQLAIMYRLCKDNVIGYHLINVLLFICLSLLLYVLLSQLAQPPAVSLTVALVYALLPHYATDRFWIAAFQANLCMVFYLSAASCITQVSATRGFLRSVWASLSVLGGSLSVLAYEVSVPFLILLPVFAGSRTKDQRSIRMKIAVLTAVMVTGAVVFKLLTQTRYKFRGRFLAHPAQVVWHFAQQFFEFNFGYYGLWLPRTTWHAITSNTSPLALGLSGVAGILIFAYFFRTLARFPSSWPSRKTWPVMLVAGIGIFALGYSPFAADVTATITTTGVANRVTIAAALGTAIALVAVIGWTSEVLFSPAFRITAFSTAVAIVCTSFLLIINVIASYWTAAYEVQQKVIADIRTRFAELPRETTLILDGGCPYIGPGVVFEGFLDTEAMLRIVYRDETIRGDVVTPRLRVSPDGLHTFFYSQENKYAYGNRLIIYNYQKKTTARLVTFEDAREYFRARSSSCPAGKEGYGAPILGMAAGGLSRS